MKKLLLVPMFLLALACSSEPPLAEGTVIDRRFEPAHWEGGWENVSRYGYKCGIDFEGEYSCGLRHYTDQVWEDEHIWRNDSYKIQLKNCQTEEGKEKCREGWRTVTESEYDRYSIGNHYPNPA